jgi:polyvinyl alcohol dehydrogenase (cytochrome)
MPTRSVKEAIAQKVLREAASELRNMKSNLFACMFAIVILLVLRVCVSVEAQKADVAASKPVSPTGQCTADAAQVSTKSDVLSWSGWSPGQHNTRFQPAAQAGLRLREVPRLRLKWAFGFSGDTMAFSQPAVFGGRLFIGSESGDVFALNANSGCTEWSFHAQASVRTGFVIRPGSVKHKASSALYFGDQHGLVYALDSATGQLVWKAQADPHRAAMITGTPQLWQGHLYVPVASYEENFAPDRHYECCTFRGSIVAYEAQTGEQIWKTYTVSEAPHKTSMSKAGTQLWGPSGVGVWSSPTLDPERHVL